RFADGAASKGEPAKTKFSKKSEKPADDRMLDVSSLAFTPGQLPAERLQHGQRYPGKSNIVTTVFWIGEEPSGNNPVPNRVSSWDKDWSRRKLPRATVPRARGKTTSALQPFYYESRASKLESCASRIGKT